MKHPKNYWTYERCKEEALKYETKTEFIKESKKAYQVTLRNKWIDEICNHMTPLVKFKGYWTYERCKEEALKYQSKTDFQRNSKGAYNSARNNMWFDDVCSHMICINNISKTYGYWTYERCKEEALKYTTKNEYKRKSAGSYKSIMVNKWVKELCSHMPNNDIKPNNYWTKERCIEEAKKYKTRCEFKNNACAAYSASIKNSWIDDICHHMPNRFYAYTKEECLIESLKYKSKTEFMSKSVSIYLCCRKNNWLDDVCDHMILIGNKYNRCIYAAEFPDNCVYVGLTYNLDNRIKDHLHSDKSSIFRHIVKTGYYPIFKRLTEYLDVNIASKLEGVKLNEYIEIGWLPLNINKCGGI